MKKTWKKKVGTSIHQKAIKFKTSDEQNLVTK